MTGAGTAGGAAAEINSKVDHSKVSAVMFKASDDPVMVMIRKGSFKVRDGIASFHVTMAIPEQIDTLHVALPDRLRQR